VRAAALLVVIAAATTPAAGAADVLQIDSLTPSAGVVPPVPGGAGATPDALNPSNTIIAKVTFPSAASYQKVFYATVSWTSAPQVPASSNKNLRLVMRPYQQKPVSGPGPVHATLEFGWSCYPTSVPETTFTTIEIHMAQDQLASSAYRISGQAPANLVVKCPQPVAKVPVNPALFAAPTPVPAAKATPVSTKKP
jgi:hypothetical protein